jgi:hypothetical protein
MQFFIFCFSSYLPRKTHCLKFEHQHRPDTVTYAILNKKFLFPLSGLNQNRNVFTDCRRHTMKIHNHLSTGSHVTSRGRTDSQTDIQPRVPCRKCSEKASKTLIGLFFLVLYPLLRLALFEMLVTR